MDFSYLDDWKEEELGGEALEEGGEGYRNIWVLAETAGGGLLPASLEALGQARELADQIGVYVYGVLLGPDGESLAERLFAYGADKVLVAGAPALARYQPELYVEAMAKLVAQYRPEILLLAATSLGSDLAPALAQKLNTGLMSQCVKLGLDMSERLLLGTYPVLGGEVYNTAACPEARPQMATLLPGYFRVPYEDTYRTGSVEQVDLDLDEAASKLAWSDGETAVELPPVPLRKARVVVSGGRGMGDAEGFALVQKLAAALGGVAAGSRGALDEGWIGEGQVVGVGGELIAPDLYVACGLSGDVYHYFGVQNSKFVVAINADPKAPIMKAANIAIVGDARQVIPAMLEALGA
jgi:electron transfer flavoprotein alpha subunit